MIPYTTTRMIVSDKPPQEYWNPYTSTLPVPGETSGTMKSGMNYQFLPRDWQPSGWGQAQGGQFQGVSPLQQMYVPGYGNRSGMGGGMGGGMGYGGGCGGCGGNGGGDNDGGPFASGTPVRIMCLQGEGMSYNGLIGDIVGQGGYHGSAFTVRVPLADPREWMRILDGTDMGAIGVSSEALEAIKMNRRLVAEAQNLAEEEKPYLLLTGLPSEKLEVVGQRNSG
eukprot:NODE_15095_length_1068_cov_6.509033.p1 GENE.NODE_15095_length_1068_cov_6.509033~~NODE_15095_length_1068_cov_6.509033.p1  ORF type:complete len:224 (+),score=60.59 NODE_15095_length_1068_cov_6.509033:101-772(+)